MLTIYTTKAQKTVSVMRHFLPVDTTLSKVETNLFGQLEFCVMNGDNDSSKEDIEMLLYQHGATLTQHPTKNTFAAIASREGSTNVGDLNIVSCEGNQPY